MTAIDAQMVEQGDVVGGVGIPGVLRGDWGAGLATSVSLVHRDDAKFVSELLGRIDRRRGLAPDVDHRLQPRGREGQNWETLSELLVVDAGAMMVKARHFRFLSR